ncbi:MAG: hypothetical protein CVT89_04730 [Candidatus Altiarchaeales archaeon HGW-Altiarchaeales-2]|nr:MAG: hypothetical protein CVT89_04730 [Candidatus Altiarchaeales archaeon HGW-Altiarchaeales-2]
MENITINATSVLARKLEYAVTEGHYKNKSAAILESINLLIRKHKLQKIRMRIMRSREGTENMPSLTEIIIKSHEEEDEK